MTAEQVWWMALGALAAGGLLIVVVAFALTVGRAAVWLLDWPADADTVGTSDWEQAARP